MSGDDAPHMICMVCGRTLEQVLDRLHGGRTVGYRHSMLDALADHVPVAARPEEAPAQVKYRCDFCLEEPVTHTMVIDRETYLEAVNVRYDAEWAMCRPCTDLALADDWVNLRRRAFAAAEENFGGFSEEAKMDMRVLYRELRDHIAMFYEEPTR